MWVCARATSGRLVRAPRCRWRTGPGHLPPYAAGVTADRSLLHSVLPRVDRTARRLSHPGTGVPLRSLVVADVNLDSGQVRRLAPLTAFEVPPEGVHALCWFHGVPIGEVTLVGDPERLLPQVAEQAWLRLRQDLVAHLLEDALATRGGLTAAADRGLLTAAHPPTASGPLPTVTVAVCTRDRPEALSECLTALGELEPQVLEVLVVDNASGDDSTRRVAESFPFVRYLHEPRPGLDWARNLALLEARGDVIAYTDDDVLVHPQWAGALAQVFVEEPSAACVTGLVAPAELSTPAQVLFEAAGGFGRGYRRRWFGAAVEEGEVAAAAFGGTGQAGTGANMAYRRQIALDLGGFDPALDVGTLTGGGGDLEMFFRVVAAGHVLVYDPTAVVRHRHRPDLPTLHRQMRGNGTGAFSAMLGAGRAYGPRQHAAFRSLVTSWFLPYYARQWVRGLVAPEVLPPSLAAAERRGALDAVLHRYYDQAAGAAAELAAAAGSAPVLAPVRHPAPPAPPRRPDPVLTVELLGEAAPDEAAAAARAGRRIRILVLRGGRLQDVFSEPSQGAALSAARLRSALVRRLGAALLEEGRTWYGEEAELVGASSSAVRGRRYADLTPAQAAACDELLRAPHRRADPPLPVHSPARVSVLMATRDRPELLAVSLAAIAQQKTERAVQVVVVDNSPDPRATAQVVDRHPGMQWVHEPVPGLSRARNAGFPQVDGAVVVFVDDDVVVPPDWLERLLRPFADPRVGAVTGNVLAANVDELAAQVFEDYGGLGRGPHRRVYLPEWLTTSTRAVPTWLIGATANAALRTELLRKLGPWDEALGPGTPSGVGEDTEYFYRVLRSGHRIVYEPTAAVQHRHRPDLASLRQQLRAYSSGHVAYHLQVLARYGDLRGLQRLALPLPRHLARQARWIRTGRSDYPRELLSAEIRGVLSGPAAWLAARRRARRTA